MRRRSVVAALVAPLGGLLCGVGAAAVVMVPAAQGCAAATYSSHVTLVVEHGNSQVTGLCIGFDGASITGEQILQASGLQYATQSYGSLGDAVCQIDGEPASYGSCLPASGPYWAMFVSRGGGAWQGADRGVSTETFTDGDAEGFRYDDQGGSEPPPASPAGVCARALAAAAGSSGASTAPPAAQPSSAAAGSASQGAAPARSPAAAGAATPDAAGSAAAAGSSDVPAPAVVTAAPHGLASAAGATPRPADGPDPWVLAACLAGGGLAGLAVVRLARRRRA